MSRALLGVGLSVTAVLAAGACDLPAFEAEPACEGWRPGDVVLTEVMPDPEGADTGREWVELHNPGRVAVDLRGLLLYAAREDGSGEKAYLFEDSVTVEPRDYLVLGDVRDGGPVAPVDHVYGDALGALGNTGGVVGVRCGDVLVDEVRYGKPGRSGVSRGYDGRLVPDALDNDAPERWCDAPVAPDGGMRASPGAANAPCPSADAGLAPDTCLSSRTGQSRSLVPPRPGDLRFTEVMADPRAVPDAQGEWVELRAARDVDLNGLVLSTEGTGQALLTAPSRCLEMRAGTHAVLAHGDTPALNGGLPAVLATFPFALGNGGGGHALRLTWKGERIAEAVWTGAPLPGVSWQLGASDGGVCPAPEGARYGAGDRGSPGAENPPCAR